MKFLRRYLDGKEPTLREFVRAAGLLSNMRPRTRRAAAPGGEGRLFLVVGADPPGLT